MGLCMKAFFVLFLVETVFMDVINPITVKTSHMSLVGFESSLKLHNGEEVQLDIFKGIPYAMPPIGARRFMTPKDVTKGDGDELLALDSSPLCHRYRYEFIEAMTGDSGMPDPPSPGQGPGAGLGGAGGGAGGAGGGGGLSLSDLFGVGKRRKKREAVVNPTIPIEDFSYEWDHSMDSSEDCLYLNIFKPNKDNTTTNNNESVPVVIWVHGQGPHPVDGAQLAVNLQSIVVTFSYRQSVYGFFSLGTEDYPGNLGLFDQLKAFKWVRDNIAYFGGDRDKVTIAGDGPGATDVAMHVSNPKTKGLFQKAMSLNGFTTHFKHTKQEVEMASNAVFLSTKCNEENKMKCLKGMNEGQVMSWLASILEGGLDFVPIPDGFLLDTNPLDAIDSGDFNKVPFLIGLNSDEGLYDVLNVLRPYYDDGITMNDLLRDIQNDIKKFTKSKYAHLKLNSTKLDKLESMVSTQYNLDYDGDIFSTMRKAIDMYSDMNSFVPTLTLAESLSKESREVYLYFLNHSLAANKERYEFSLGIPVGAGYADSLHLAQGTDSILSSSETALSSKFLQMLRDFVHDGTPTIVGADGRTLPFPKYGDRSQYVLIEDEDTPFSIRESLFDKSIDIWKTLFPAAIEDVSKTCQNQITKQPTQPKGADYVLTTNGIIRGKRGKYAQMFSYQAFLGIPYAAPPVGQYRWKPPRPSEAWSEILDARQFGPSCPQESTRGQSENCLFLNIWTPFNMEIMPKKRYPVIVYLHGGKFLEGTGNSNSLLGLSFMMDVILVSVNYRLGVFGFLSTETAEHPGNLAHRDILMALEWISKNINSFNGDKENIVLFGEDSGAALASQLLFFRNSHGLFHTVVSMGGSSSAPWANDPNPKKTLKEFARSVGCDNPSMEETMMCLRGKDKETLITPHTNIGDTPLSSYPWRPTSNWYFNWKDASFPMSTSLISGLIPLEGTHMINRADLDKFGPEIFIRDFISTDIFDSKVLFEHIREAYFQINHTDKDAVKKAVSEVLSDWAYREPHISDCNRIIRDGGTCYAYEFDYKMSQSDKAVEGPVHGDDFLLLKHTSAGVQSSNQEQLLVGRKFMDKIKETAFGVPGRNPTFHWDSYNKSGAYLKIPLNGSAYMEQKQPENHSGWNRLHIWTHMLATYASLNQICREELFTEKAPTLDVSKPSQPSLNESNNDTKGKSKEKPNVLPPVIGRSSAGELAVGLFDISLLTSQIMLLAAGGVCVVLLVISIGLAAALCKRGRRNAEDPTRDDCDFTPACEPQNGYAGNVVAERYATHEDDCHTKM